MPWQEVDTMTLRREFIMLAQQEDSNISELCKIFGISRKTGYKWLDRFDAHSDVGLMNRSRRSHARPPRSGSIPYEVRDAKTGAI